MKEYFVKEDSIVRKIWGKSDTILVVFAGASAEFALNKAVDWLYFTGKLPADPLVRLFTTVSYAREIVFSEKEEALAAIQNINKIHSRVEESRGSTIPDWAYRDVLFMLIDYSIRAYELLEHPLSEDERKEVFGVFYRVGKSMEISELPRNFSEFKIQREQHLKNDLQYSDLTKDLFKQYKNHLGVLRYTLLLETQSLIVPSEVRKQMGFRKNSLLGPLISLYKCSRSLKLDQIFKDVLLPSEYKKEIKQLDFQ